MSRFSQNPSILWFSFILGLLLWLPWFSLLILLLFLALPQELHGSEKHHLGEGNQLAQDQPDVDHLDVRGGGQPLHLANEDGGHHQHVCEVDAQACFEEARLEEGCSKGDCDEKQGWEVSGHQLACYFSLQC